MHLHRLLTLSVSVLVSAACASGAADKPSAADGAPQATVSQGTLPQNLCDLVPQADAERIMGTALRQKRGDDSGCEYQDARGTAGTGLWIYLNALEVLDQCRLTRGSQPLSGLGEAGACITIGQPAGLYTTVAFRGGGRTFEVVAPGETRRRSWRPQLPECSCPSSAPEARGGDLRCGRRAPGPRRRLPAGCHRNGICYRSVV